MKKIYALAAATLAAVSMNAQLYVCGNGEGLGWDPTNPFEVELTGDVYKFTINNLVEFKMSSAMGNAEGADDTEKWAPFNENCYYANVTEDLVGQPVELEINGETNFSAPWKGDWTIEVAQDYSTVILTTTTPKPDPDAAPAVFIRGGMNNWGNDEGFAESDTWKFNAVKNADDVWEFSFVAKGATMIQQGVEFKIADADWGAYNYGGGDVTAFDDEMPWNHNGSNTKVFADFEGTIKFTAPEEPKGEIFVTFSTEISDGIVGVEIDENAPVEYFNLQGIRVANPENGLFIARQGEKIVKIVK